MYTDLLRNALYVSVFCLFSSTLSHAQVTTYPIQENAVLQNFHKANPAYQFQGNLKSKFGNRDTLELPFFDDFSESNLYPDSTKWLNNQVYINNHFPIQPPTINVATFDVLDANGIPYRGTINKDLSTFGDSLVSQPINLKDSVGVPYTLSDSIILSFFYQPNGNGYHLNSEDSLRLSFKAEDSTWVQVWSVAGQSNSTDFAQVLIPIKDVKFLHKGFQFAFSTYTRQVGNANHWHLDYVVLDENRSVTIDWYNDYAIQSNPSSLLKNYYTMPYEHFKVNSVSETAPSVTFRASNLLNIGKNILVRHEASSGGNTLVSTNFIDNSNNILAQSSAERTLPSFNFANLSGSKPVITHTVSVQENGVVNDYKENDNITVQLEFEDYYAYDDGSAERGFGFDQNTNPSNIEGQIALGFNVLKQERLYAIATYFNEAVFDVSARRFRYRIWKNLAGVDGAAADELIYESELQVPDYNSANGERTFSAHYLDTNLILSPGKYYIGWWQPEIFNLNVGWDMNFGNTQNPNRPNPMLYYNTFDIWSNSGVPDGTLMMRPHFGDSVGIYLGVPEQQVNNKQIKVYPNPASSIVYLTAEFAQISLYTMSGVLLKSEENKTSLAVNDVAEGLYYLRLVNEKGELFTSKIVIIAP
jgi:hypothetical protein